MGHRDIGAIAVSIIAVILTVAAWLLEPTAPMGDAASSQRRQNPATRPRHSTCGWLG